MINWIIEERVKAVMDEKKDTLTNEMPVESENFLGDKPVIISEEDAQEVFGEEKVEQKEEDSSSKEKIESYEENRDFIYPKELEEIERSMNENVSVNEEFQKEIDLGIVADEISKETEPVIEEEQPQEEIPKEEPNVEETSEIEEKEVLEMPAEFKKELKESEEPKEEKKEQQEEQTKVPPKKRRNPIVIMLNILATLFFLFIIFETVIAFMNFNLIKQDKEPQYFVTTTKETKDGYDYTIHDMGLFKIVRKESQRDYETKLLPFFLDI